MTTISPPITTTVPSRAARAITLSFAVVGLALLLVVGFLLVRSENPLYRFAVTGDGLIDGLFTAQLTMLGVVAVFALLTRWLMPENFAKYFRRGDMAAPVTPVRLLGITGKESWLRVGLTFTIAISVVTAIVTLILPALSMSFSLAPVAILAVVVFSASNAFIEEYLTRFQVVAALAGKACPATIALTSAVLFGLPHFFGMPGGVLGIVLAGFLGWLLAKSVLETRGLGWALVIHFVQDIIIFSAILGLHAA